MENQTQRPAPTAYQRESLSSTATNHLPLGLTWVYLVWLATSSYFLTYIHTQKINRFYHHFNEEFKYLNVEYLFMIDLAIYHKDTWSMGAPPKRALVTVALSRFWEAFSYNGRLPLFLCCQRRFPSHSCSIYLWPSQHIVTYVSITLYEYNLKTPLRDGQFSFRDPNLLGYALLRLRNVGYTSLYF